MKTTLHPVLFAWMLLAAIGGLCQASTRQSEKPAKPASPPPALHIQPAPQQHPQNSAPGNGNTNTIVPRAGAPNQFVNPPVRNHAGEWLRRYKDLPAQEQEQKLKSDPIFQRLPQQRQQQMMQQLRNFNSLPSEQQNTLIDRMHKFESLSPEQKQNLLHLNENLQQMPPARQATVREALRRLNQMAPDERERIFNSPRFQGMFNPNEIQVLKGLSGLRVPANATRPNPSSPNSNPEPPEQLQK